MKGNCPPSRTRAPGEEPRVPDVRRDAELQDLTTGHQHPIRPVDPRAGDQRRLTPKLGEGAGEVAYRVMYGNALWSIYRMIGKLESRIYVLRRGD